MIGVETQPLPVMSPPRPDIEERAKAWPITAGYSHAAVLATLGGAR